MVHMKKKNSGKKGCKELNSPHFTQEETEALEVYIIADEMQEEGKYRLKPSQNQ